MTCPARRILRTLLRQRISQNFACTAWGLQCNAKPHETPRQLNIEDPRVERIVLVRHRLIFAFWEVYSIAWTDSGLACQAIGGWRIQGSRIGQHHQARDTVASTVTVQPKCRMRYYLCPIMAAAVKHFADESPHDE